MATASEARGSSRSWVDRRVGLFGLVALVALAIGVAVFVFQLIPRDPGEDSAEAGFLRDMSEHHLQAVEMALIIHDRTGDEELGYLTTDIALTQNSQVGTMQGWLDVWDLSPNGEDPPMTWMDHPITEGRMPGMAAPDEVERLRTIPVDQAEVLFLQLMIRHHQGGVAMAEALLERSDQPQVTRLARSIVAAQRSEIEAMNQMLQQRGQPPITDPLPADNDHTEHDG
ncbi:MAG: DUF305 domain-containing protein [Chloroflexia bacterium]|nr:DUF305 domain-containing protein [Chloroflexia bacterium]